jgi:uncharacterized protein (TIGR03546 family)
MLSDFVAILRKAARFLLAHGSPGQMAAGFTIGMVIGFAPKGNLIALSLCVVLFSIRCNRGLGLAAAVLFSFVGPWTDSFTHKLGTLVLTYEPLQATYASALTLPIMPWTGFNNTVVTGSLLTALYIAYPVFWLSRQLFAATQSLVCSHQPARDAVAPPRATP